MRQDRIRTARLEARIAPDGLALVQQAAALQGRSVSDFVITAAQDAARKALEDAYLIRLAADDQARFVDLLLDPPALAPAMKRARAVHKQLASGEG